MRELRQKVREKNLRHCSRDFNHGSSLNRGNQRPKQHLTTASLKQQTSQRSLKSGVTDNSRELRKRRLSQQLIAAVTQNPASCLDIKGVVRNTPYTNNATLAVDSRRKPDLSIGVKSHSLQNSTRSRLSFISSDDRLKIVDSLEQDDGD